MGRATNRLTSRFVQTVKEPGRYADGAGLYLYLDKPKPKKGIKPDPNAVGTKRWVFMFTWDGARKEMGLGSAAPTAVGLAEARTAAEDARKLVREGVNPIEARKKAPTVTVEPRLFKDVAAALVKDLARGWKSEKHAKQWTSSLKNNAPAIWKAPVHEVDTEAVLRALRPIWATKAETASRVRGRIEHVLDAARVEGDIIGPWENPARWKGHLARLLGKRQVLARGHHPAMPFADVPAFTAALRQREAVAASALEFTILNASRTGEVLGAVGAELDLEGGVWIIPPERMKAGREHRVPLTPRAVEIVRELHPNGLAADAYVFPGQKPGKPLSNMAMDMLLRRMDQDAYTVHGFRSSFRDWAGETTNFAREDIEAALAHIVGSRVERAYRRGDALMKRRKLMEAWASYLANPPAGNVRQLGPVA